MSSSPSPSGSRARKSILLVEDDKRVCRIIEEAFMDEYDVRVVHDGLAGFIEATGNDRPDVIIADVEMPKLNGVGMVRRIRRQEGNTIPVIFLTNRERPADVIAGIKAGARHYLAKPLNIEVLRDKLQHTLKAG